MFAGRIQKILDDIRYSYWFLPTVMAALSSGLAFLALEVDQGWEPQAVPGLGWLYSAGPEGARALLSTVASAMLGVAGVTFSVTIVALSVASQQYGPRLLVNFMRDRGNQFVLGAFIATFLYCVLVLRQVRFDQPGHPGFVPHLSVTLGVVLTVLSLGVLIYFIHHVARSIQVTEIIARIGHELDHTIDQLFPAPLGFEANSPEAPVEDIEARFRSEECEEVAAMRTGYVHVIDQPRLLRLARRHDLLIRLRRRPGGWVIEGDILLDAWPREHTDHRLVGHLRQAVILGARRTTVQDIGFSIDQLAQLGARALSPSLNDPNTAQLCIDRLTASLGRLARREIPPRLHHDQDGVLRLVTPPTDWSEVFGQAIGPLRRYGAAHFSVVLRLLEMMQRLAPDLRRTADREALRAEAEKVLGAALRSDMLPADLEQLRARHRLTIWALRPERFVEDEEEADGPG